MFCSWVFPVSIIGSIAIPGMTMRAVLDGSSIVQAAWLQMIIVCMISSSSVLSCIVATHLVLRVCVDPERRIRGDCIDTGRNARRRPGDGIEAVVSTGRMRVEYPVSGVNYPRGHARNPNGGSTNSRSERTRLPA